MSCLCWFILRCTRRSECKRAEEKNGWLWSPVQQCVKIASFSPPNLSREKRGSAVRLCDGFLSSLCLCRRLKSIVWVTNCLHYVSETGTLILPFLYWSIHKLKLSYNFPPWLCLHLSLKHFASPLFIVLYFPTFPMLFDQSICNLQLIFHLTCFLFSLNQSFDF